MAEDASFLDDVENLVVLSGDLGLTYASDTVDIFTNTTLPRPELIKDALEAYCRYSGALFYLFPAEEIQELYKKVYWTAGGASRGTLCALCALASLGYHYDVEYADLQIIQKFYNTAKLYLDVCLEEDKVYGMRVMVLLAANCIMEKRTAAWYWISTWVWFHTFWKAILTCSKRRIRHEHCKGTRLRDLYLGRRRGRQQQASNLAKELVNHGLFSHLVVGNCEVTYSGATVQFA